MSELMIGDRKIGDLLQEMTLEEKASLLSGNGFWYTKAVERLGIPATMVSDGPHGLRKQDDRKEGAGINDSISAVCFPAACAGAASFDREVLRQIGESLGDACQHEDVSVILGPAVNIKRSPLCGRNFEYYSEDPYLTGELSSAMIKGVQSRGVGTSIKHFAANSQEHRRMSSDSVIDERTLREIYLPAFETAVKKAKPWTVMCSYNRLNGTYASQNHWLLTKVLREEWGFDGYTVSDWGAVSDRVKAVAAGLDLEMPSQTTGNDQRIVSAVKNGELAEKAVDRCVLHILTVIGRYLHNRRPETVWDMEAQHTLAGKLAAQCMVLLKNEDDVLPIAQEETVAVIGKFAEKPRFQGGGSSHINCFRTESLLDALAGNDKICYAPGYDILSEELDETLIAQAEAAAAGAGKAVIIAGLPDSFESEGYDRTHLRMPENQNELIRRVAKVNPNTIVVLYNGSPVQMPWLNEVKGVVEAYLGGQAVGMATKQILWGEVCPGGRLPETFPMKLEDTPCYLSYGGEGNTAVYNEGIFVGYRYYDKKKMQVLFPFGYGLSYTSFSYDHLNVSAKTINDTDSLSVQAEVTNTGKMAGHEVVQLYVSAPESRVFRPVRELKGFEKVFLKPGETKTVSMTLDSRSFAYWDSRAARWVVESGEYRIQVCRNSREVILEIPVCINSTQKPYIEELTPDTIFMDLADHPKAEAFFADRMRRAMGVLDTSAEGTDAAKEAITDEMNDAVLRYLPLRGMISFGDEDVTYDEIAEEVSQLVSDEKGQTV